MLYEIGLTLASFVLLVVVVAIICWITPKKPGDDKITWR